MGDDPNDWYPDPNVGLKKMMDRTDACMGRPGPPKQNVLTKVCEENYGEEVALLDCMFCGMMCECPSPTECDMDCHQGCMSMDEEPWKEEEHHGADEGCGLEECKMFYGEDVKQDECEDCGNKCFEEASAVADSPEKFFNYMVSCSDECMGQKNAVSQQCEAGYGPEVDIFACFNCGMECACDAQQCNEVCHGDCMAGGGGSATFGTYSDWGDLGGSTYPGLPSDWASTYPTYGALLQASKSGKLQNLKLSSALRLYVKSAQLSAKAKSDVTDLMQSSKHLSAEARQAKGRR